LVRPLHQHLHPGPALPVPNIFRTCPNIFRTFPNISEHWRGDTCSEMFGNVRKCSENVRNRCGWCTETPATDQWPAGWLSVNSKRTCGNVGGGACQWPAGGIIGCQRNRKWSIGGLGACHVDVGGPVGGCRWGRRWVSVGLSVDVGGDVGGCKGRCSSLALARSFAASDCSISHLVRTKICDVRFISCLSPSPTTRVRPGFRA
jgi:hypothetical protein